jgi:hypothetical protein
MPIPNLLHPVPIEIRQTDKAGTPQDHDFREPINRVKRQPTQTVDGQVAWANDKRIQYTRGGSRYDADGYVLFRYVDLEAKSMELKTGDKLVKIGKITSNVYIVHFQPQGHYTDVGGATLVKAFFSDKDPVKQD